MTSHTSVAEPNAWPKSIPTANPDFIMIMKLVVCRSPIPRSQCVTHMTAYDATNRLRSRTNDSGLDAICKKPFLESIVTLISEFGITLTSTRNITPRRKISTSSSPCFCATHQSTKVIVVAAKKNTMSNSGKWFPDRLFYRLLLIYNLSTKLATFTTQRALLPKHCAFLEDLMRTAA